MIWDDLDARLKNVSDLLEKDIVEELLGLEGAKAIAELSSITRTLVIPESLVNELLRLYLEKKRNEHEVKGVHALFAKLHPGYFNLIAKGHRFFDFELTLSFLIIDCQMTETQRVIQLQQVRPSQLYGVDPLGRFLIGMLVSVTRIFNFDMVKFLLKRRQRFVIEGEIYTLNLPHTFIGKFLSSNLNLQKITALFQIEEIICKREYFDVILSLKQKPPLRKTFSAVKNLVTQQTGRLRERVHLDLDLKK
ncbi:hypothetical protein WDW89_20340 [Deltaproteobacteria bacterium TL4]